MVKPVGCLIVAVAFIFVLPGYLIALDQYWISFSGRSTRGEPHPPGGPWQVMKIDALGNIVVPPTIVVRNSSQYTVPGNAGAAISHGEPGKLVLWIPTRRGSVTGYIYRAIIDENSLSLLSLTQTGIKTVNKQHLQAAQSGPLRFLAATRLSKSNPARPFYVGSALSRDGQLLGQGWRLTPREASCYTCGMGVSSGGRVFFFTDFSEEPHREFAMLQPLDRNGRPNGSPYEVARSELLYLQDVSGIVRADSRYVLYSTLGPYPARLWLTIVDTRSRKAIGDPIELAKRAGTIGQFAAVDPAGRFVVFCSLADPRYPLSSLVFQALDAIGRPSGEGKVIAYNVASGIDILGD